MEFVREEVIRVKKALMTGVGYMIPFVVFGGILIALTIAFSKIGEDGINITNPLLARLNELGSLSMSYMVPVLGAFIAFGIADRAGIMPGFIGSAIAAEAGTGFLGALVAGILAGYIVNLIKKIPLPVMLKSLMPIFIIPLLGGLAVALLMEYVICAPLTSFNQVMTDFLTGMRGSNIVVLGAILGFMTALDLGGPVNVVACLFAWAMFDAGIYTLAGPVAVGICTPPLGMGLATLLSKKKYDNEDREAGKAALAMGMIGISEGAIPFAAKDPLRVIPANCIGGMVGGIIAMVLGVSCYAPHGGPIVTMVVDKKIPYLIAILAGALVTAVIANTLKKEVSREEG
ncbi:PTS fructose transporter subunit IIC [Lacrimispora sp.]|jgi:PTS system fructose-specific IIC component|uniref:PTS fructose transporter subunit IIC n=1 Tax=Lacrimispora sp. TaxID=2719234 RepID=UPI0028A08D76|nr:fructose-specific PTS transporter subunit EIIC [Lacrimispora sp.]